MNTIYIVCLHHPSPAFSCRIGVRGGTSGYAALHRTDQLLEKFFETHKLCGGGFDHFALAFELPKDHDLPKAEPLAEGVHAGLRLVKANGHEH